MTAVTFDSVTVEFSGERVLEDVDLGVERGEVFGVVGANGAGKSTLLRTVNGVLTPESGDVELLGDSVISLSHRERARRVATLPQSTELSFEYTVEQVVEMGRHASTPRVGGDPEPDAVDDAMEDADLEGFRGRSIDDVSGGERQRVLLARCLAQRTPVVVMDEPTASLDVHRAVEVLELVHGLARVQDKAVLAAIHDLDLAARYCDRIALLADGEVTAMGAPCDVLSEENVEDAFGGRVSTSHEGFSRVSAFSDSMESQREPVHVVGNGGACLEAVYALWKKGYRVTVGAISGNDPCLSTIDSFADTVVAEEPYSRVTPESVERVRRLVDDAEAAVVALSTFTEGFTPNFRALEDASEVALELDDLTEDEAEECEETLAKHGVRVEPSSDTQERDDGALSTRDRVS